MTCGRRRGWRWRGSRRRGQLYDARPDLAREPTERAEAPAREPAVGALAPPARVPEAPMVVVLGGGKMTSPPVALQSREEGREAALGGRGITRFSVGGSGKRTKGQTRRQRREAQGDRGGGFSKLVDLGTRRDSPGADFRRGTSCATAALGLWRCRAGPRETLTVDACRETVPPPEIPGRFHRRFIVDWDTLNPEFSVYRYQAAR